MLTVKLIKCKHLPLINHGSNKHALTCLTKTVTVSVLYDLTVAQWQADTCQCLSEPQINTCDSAVKQKSKKESKKTNIRLGNINMQSPPGVMLMPEHCNSN